MLIRYVHRYFILIDIKKYIPVYINGRFQTFLSKKSEIPEFRYFVEFISYESYCFSWKYPIRPNFGTPTDCVGVDIHEK